MKKFSILLTAWAAASPAFAHAGHGHDNPLSPGHYVNNPEHAIPLTLAFVVCIIVITWFSYKVQHRINKK